MIQLVWQLMMAVGLAASAGLRAFLPLLVVGAAARLELVPLGERFGWLASTPALTVLAVAVAVELLADKIPLLDHVLDMFAVVARPAAGALAAAAPLTQLEPLTAAVVGIVLGGGVAGSVHAAKATLRVTSTGTTAGLANPALSAAEDAASLAASVVSLFLPVVTFTLAVAVVYLLVRGRRGSAASPSVRQ